MKLDKIQPSQLFISSEKLSQVMKMFDSTEPESFEPIPVKNLGDQVIFVDGHTRVFVALLRGFLEVSVYWEEDELDWDAYEICVEWCKNEGIHTIADLKDKVVSLQEYEIVWLKRCEKMQQESESRRRQYTFK